MNKLVWILCLLLFPAFIYSDEVENSLQFSRENWKVAIEEFSGDLSESYEYLKSSIPDLIRKELISSDTHLLSNNEIDDYQKSLVKEARKKLIVQLSQNFKKKDNLLFDVDSTDSAKKTIEDDIGKIQNELLLLSDFESSQIKTADILQVLWINSDEDENLLDAEQYIASVQSNIYDLDLLITGNIEKVDEYFYIEVSGYYTSTSEKILIYSNAGSTDDIETMAFEAANELRSVILGRAWAILKVVTDREDALIYSDGRLIGIGSTEIKTMEPGTVFLEAIGTDNSYWSSEMELSSLEVNTIEGTLSRIEVDFLTLSTEPPNADVYIGARWAGKTPLNLPMYDDKNLWITIRSEGFYDIGFELSKDNPENIFYELVEVDLTPLENFQLKKKQFYKSLGWFSISVAAPMITGGVYMNYLDRQNAYALAGFTDLADQMKTNYYISYGTFWGTIGISGGLLVDVFVKLSRYIKAAEALTQ